MLDLLGFDIYKHKRFNSTLSFICFFLFSFVELFSGRKLGRFHLNSDEKFVLNLLKRNTRMHLISENDILDRFQPETLFIYIMDFPTFVLIQKDQRLRFN